MRSTAIINTPEVVAWSFFPRTLTQTFSGEPIEIRPEKRGNATPVETPGRKSRERAAFFAQADAAAKVCVFAFAFVLAFVFAFAFAFAFAFVCVCVCVCAYVCLYTHTHTHTQAADELLGQRPGVLIGPLPAGLDPSVMWRVTRYNL